MNNTLRNQQFTLARHLRDPLRHAPPPGLEDRRLEVYRELFYGTIEGLLATSFPVLRQTLGEQCWHARVRDFYARYRCRSPLFTELAGAFVDYLQGVQPEASWEVELTHYECVESQLYLSDAKDPPHDPEGDLQEAEPLLSCMARVLAYHWPVDRIGPGFQPKVSSAAPTFLLVYRGADLCVHFARLSPMAYRLLVLQGRGRDRLQALLASPQEGLAMLRQLREQGIIVGTR